MSKRLELLLGQAQEKERVYDWVKAVDLYRKVSRYVMKLEDSMKLAEVCERVGYCLFRSAFQAETKEDFRAKMRAAFQTYGEAADLYKKIEKESERDHCRAIAFYIQSQFSSKSAERRICLNECSELQKHVIKAYKQCGDRLSYGKTCNELLTCLIDILNLEFDWKKRKQITEEAINYGENGIRALSDAGNVNELIRAYSMMSLLCYYAEDCCDLSASKRAYSTKGMEYAQGAVDLSNKVMDDYVVAISNYAMAYSTYQALGDLEVASKIAEKALENSTKTKDKFLTGAIYTILAEITHWMMDQEENSDKKKEIHSKAAQYAEGALQCCSIASKEWYVPGIAHGYYWYAESYLYLATEIETSPEARYDLLLKAVQAGRDCIESAERSGMPEPTANGHHALSKALYFLSFTEMKADERRKLLEETLKHRKEYVSIISQAFPFRFWGLGVGQNYQSLINAELAKIEVNEERKRSFLQEAVLNMESCLQSCKKYAEFYEQKRFFALIGSYQDWFGRVMTQLYSFTKKEDLAQKAIEAYEGCIEAFSTVDWPCHVAEANWRIARIKDKLGKHLESTINFEMATKEYKKAAVRIPQFKTFYLNLSRYMQAWSEIEKARDYHAREEYDRSAELYKKAAELHSSSRLWGHLGLNYSAWAQLELAEDLSRKDRGKDSIVAFEQAIKLFVEAKKALDAAIPEIEGSDELDVAVRLSTASDQRQEYCRGRICLEEAKIFEREGKRRLSAEKYGLTADMFQRMESAPESEFEREELRFIICLCKAWQKMMLAEERVSPELYRDASELFEKAKEHTIKERKALLALGNSCLCKALQAEIGFEATGDASLYSRAKQHMEKASNLYLKAGFGRDSVWVNASEALFDAYVYMSKAETEMDHQRKMQLYRIAERYLERSAGLYGKIGDVGKRDYVQELLEKVKEKRRFAASLEEVLKVPHVASSTTLISTPTPAHENAAGLERFESASVQANLAVPEEVNVGEVFNIELDLVNVAKNFGLLVRIDNLIPKAFRVAKSPPEYVLDDGSLHLKGRRLDPLKVESIKVFVQATEVGAADLCPRIVYVDDVGKLRTFRPEALRVIVNPPLAFKFERKTAQKIFDYLVDAFAEDYMRRRLSVEVSGWRSLMQIVREAGVSKRSVYGAGGRLGPALSELERQRLVETRIFVGERGRGGRIFKARTAYGKETVRRYVDQHVPKIVRKSRSITDSNQRM